MLEFLFDNLSVEWVVLIVALLPMLESKTAIPLGMSVQIWGDEALSPIMCFLLAVIGSVLPSIFIIFLAKLIKKRTSGFIYERFICRVQERYKANFEKLSSKQSVIKKCMSIALFVAIPLPLTGVYTGSLIAGFSNLKWWQAFISILIGEVISGLIILLLSTLFDNSAFYILLITICLVAIFVVVNLFMQLVNRIKKEKR